MAPTTGKTTGRAAKAKTARKPRAPRAAAPVPLSEASPAKQKKFFQAVRRLLKEEGLEGELASVSLEPPASRARRGAVAEAAFGCPPGQVRRVVCSKRPNGTIACRSECQPF